MHGRLAEGGVLAVQVAGGRPPERTPFRMEVVGETASRPSTGGAPRLSGGAATRLAERQARRRRRTGDSPLHDSVVNVAGVYAALRDDIANWTSIAPELADAVRVSHLVDDVLSAASADRTVTPSAPWPTWCEGLPCGPQKKPASAPTA